MGNAIYTHPFKTIIGIAAPLYCGIFFRESTHPSTASMPLSQRLIHTRVYGQMIAVLTTVSVMAFAKGMEAEGGAYRVENGQLVRGEALPAGALRNWYSNDERIHQRRPDADASSPRADAEVVESEYEAAGRDGYDLLVPLLYAPLLPLLRIGLRARLPPERLTQLTLGVIGVALSHAGYIMFSDSSVGFRR